MIKKYAHVDADCFYVSCERLRDASLKDQPVGVLGNQGACVIAESYEMKAAGVDVAMPIWKAKELCPEGVFVKRDFRWYGLLSKRMQEVLHSFTDHIEYYSIDESFLDLSDLPQDPEFLAKSIQARMLEQTELPVSVGIAETRTLCKLASKSNKPFGTLVITPENRRAILAATPLQKVNGIGRRLIKRAEKLGLQSALDFAEQERSLIKNHFHKPGEILWYELNGLPVQSINPEKTEQKVVSRGGSLWGHHSNRDYVWGFLLRNLDRFMETLWDRNLHIQGIQLVLRCSNADNREASMQLPEFTQNSELIFEALEQCFKKAFKEGLLYYQMHIIGFPIQEGPQEQLSFFKAHDKTEKPALRELTRSINQRFGLFTLRRASSHYAKEVFKDKVSDYEITDVPGKHLF